MKKQNLLLATVGLAISGNAHAYLLGYGVFELEINASPGVTITVTYHQVNAFGFASLSCPSNPNCDSDIDIDIDSCTDPLSCSVSLCACPQDCELTTDVWADSSFGALGPSAIRWSGLFTADGGGSPACISPLHGWGASVGFDLEFSSDGNVDIEPPDCPVDFGKANDGGRETLANILCSSSGPIASSLVRFGSETSQSCASSTSLGAGSHSISGISIRIDDTYHDVTSDARFNQDDVDFLTSIIPTSDTLYTERFDFDDSGTVDLPDIFVLQCFVDACLDARRIGDADCDNDVDCDDLLLAASQPFAGEDFTGSVYYVGFDVDLDGDNDAADKTAIRDRFLEVEPAEYVLDGVLNYFDTSEFMSLYNAGDPRADVNDDGVVNFFDISAYTQFYQNPNCLAPGS